ncbi:MAG TPA: serine/threonine-protein kinase [Polyangiaceae bacterium]|jgi:serine/threonine-protein kinase
MNATTYVFDDLSPMAAPEPPQPGDILDGRYELLTELRRTAATVTYEACHRTTRRRVAIKMVSPDAAPEALPGLHARIVREARAMAMVEHPAILEVLDGGVSRTGPYLVTDLPAGCTLAHLVAERGPLGVNDAVSVASAAASVLEAVHRAGVVHRGVSPHSLLITRDLMGEEHLKLGEFGVAQVRGAGAAKITHIAPVVEAPAYTSVEQLLAYADIDARADVYSLGMTLFECLTGSVPFRGEYQQVVLAAVGATSPPRVLDLCPNAGTALASVVERAIARDRDQRFATMAEFRHALHVVTPFASTRTRLLGEVDALAPWTPKSRFGVR